MISDNIRLFPAFEPSARAAADTQYNGTATIGSAVGIPIGDAENVVAHINLGALNASLTSVTYSLHVSKLSTGNTAGDLIAITGAEYVALVAAASSQKAIRAKVRNLASTAAALNAPLYLFVKRVQVGAYAANDSVTVVATDHATAPQLPLAGTAAYTASV